MKKIKLYFKGSIEIIESEGGQEEVPTPNCPSGQTYNEVTKQCENICPEGYVWNESTQSCDEIIPTCPEGYTYNSETKKCEKDQITCPEGYIWNEITQSCEEEGGVDTSCPEGFHWDESIGKCVEDVVNVECPEGYIYDSEVGECVKDNSEYDLPQDAYIMKPDENGQFTQTMFEDAVNSGTNYIFLDADKWDIHYADSTESIASGHRCRILFSGVHNYTEENPLIIDARKCTIECYHDVAGKTDTHFMFGMEHCDNIHFRFGRVIGDKYKRPFFKEKLDENGNVVLDDEGNPVMIETGEKHNESTRVIGSGRGPRNIKILSGVFDGFMGDVTGSSSYGVTIKWEPLFYLQENGRHVTDWMNVNPENGHNETFALTGGVGYNRILRFDMFDITYEFKDELDNDLPSIHNGEYFESYSFPQGARKIRISVRAMDARRASPTKFGCQLVYHQAGGVEVHNLKIFDMGRGGLSNLGRDALVDNCEFFTSEKYLDKPPFWGPTNYHINCEDVLGKNLIIRNNKFRGKDKGILLTHNISAEIHDNEIYAGSPIYIYYLVKGNIYNNILSGQTYGGVGTNYHSVKIFNNTGTKVNINPILTVSPVYCNGAEWYNNEFDGGSIRGTTKIHDNVFNDFNLDSVYWTEDITNNTFNNMKSSFMRYRALVYKNIFNGVNFKLQHGNNNLRIEFRECTLNRGDNDDTYNFNRNYGQPDIKFKDCTLNNINITNRRVNESDGYFSGNYYFEGCTITLDRTFIIGYNNNGSKGGVNFYFKNCIFKGSGNIHGGNSFEYVIKFDNCTFEEGVTLPSFATQEPVEIPAFPLVRTQAKPEIKLTGYGLEITHNCRYSKMKLRQISTGDVTDLEIVSPYYHYTDNANDWEFSFDDGVIWDSLEE